ncbi:hypothetical protein EII18_05945 [Comamonadaceae bacterium OH3737_COT-264]|nr:hypothetical protein EII18_05945 [Comamonadaceae bacterium OH3737_COT-264]
MAGWGSVSPAGVEMLRGCLRVAPQRRKSPEGVWPSGLFHAPCGWVFKVVYKSIGNKTALFWLDVHSLVFPVWKIGALSIKGMKILPFRRFGFELAFPFVL